MVLDVPKGFKPTTINKVRLTIYDVAGRQVKELVNGKLPQGTYEFAP